MGMQAAYNPKNQFPRSPWTPTWKPTKDELVKELNPLAEKVLADWNTLKGLVERYSDVIEKRWMKKTKKKQKDLLLQAWLNMSPAHRPDFEAFRHQSV